MKKQLLIGLVLFTASLAAFPQIKPLDVGDTVPRLVLREVYNHHADSIDFGDLDGKLIILDFWSTYCLPCLKAFPKVDSLQATFKDEVQFIAVSQHDLTETTDFFSTRPFIHKPDIPFVTTDSILHQLFPHLGVPFHVWIDGEGVVRHLADGYNLTAGNIRRVLDNRQTTITRAVNNVYKETIFDPEFLSNVVYASYLARYDSSNGLKLEKRKTETDYTTSGDVVTMYQYLYHELGELGFNPFRAGRTRLAIPDSTFYKMPSEYTGAKALAWMNKHFYFYQIQVPETGADLFGLVKSDFERYFPIRSSIAEENVDCWVLIRTTTQDLLATKGGKTAHTFVQQDIRFGKLDSVRRYMNRPFSSFSSALGAHIEHITGMPFIDETGYEGNVDIFFTGETLDQPSIDGFKSELKRYGLDLIKRPEKMSVLILEVP